MAVDVSVFGRYDFFTGVPDSLLKPLTSWLMDAYGLSPERHIVAANEGNAAAIASGYYLATGRVPVVYLQNSGIGNIINPALSLLSDRVYGIPVLFIVGWRGEPGVSDEPQHVHQGEVTVRLLEDIGIAVHVIDKETTEAEVLEKIKEFETLFENGKSAAFIVSKGALTYGDRQEAAIKKQSHGTMLREDILKQIVHAAGDGIIVSTTGKTSRELFEIREQNKQGHGSDFLTVGSMGHCSSIALGIALHSPDKKIWVIDGDGAALMHTGAMTVIGASKPGNMVHIVINNAAHESVGGIPTVAGNIDLVKIAEGCGYPFSERVSDIFELNTVLERINGRQRLCFLEVTAAVGSRPDLGRPDTPPAMNKAMLMDRLGGMK